MSQLNNSSSNEASSVIVLFCDACILMGDALSQLRCVLPYFLGLDSIVFCFLKLKYMDILTKGGFNEKFSNTGSSLRIYVYDAYHLL